MKLLDKIAKRLGYIPNKVSRNLSCSWCGIPFEWHGKALDDPPSYCGKTHKRRASEARSKRKKIAEAPPKVKKPKVEQKFNPHEAGRCPTPQKLTYRTEKEAEAVIRRVDPSMHVYRCPCGSLHVGHPWKSRNGA